MAASTSNSEKVQYYRLVNQETDSDGERTHERAKVVPSSENPPKKSSGKEGSPPVQGWTTRATCLGFALVLALMLLIVLLFVALRPASTYNRNPPPPKTCQSTSCIELAGQVASMANFSADPCGDAWNYICGGLLENKVLDDYVSRWSWYFQDAELIRQKLQNSLLEVDLQSNNTAAVKAAELYRSCTNTIAIQTLGLQPLREFISSLGGWGGSGWASKSKGISGALSKVIPLQLADITDKDMLSPFFGIVPRKDTQSNITVLSVSQSGLGMASKQLYSSNSSTSRAVSAAYRKFMEGFANAIGTGASGQSNTRIAMSQVYEFEVNLSMIQASATDLRDTIKSDNRVPVANLTALLPQIDWALLLSSVADVADADILDNTTVAVSSLAYLSRLSELISTTPNEVLSNYITWLVVRSLAPVFQGPLRTAYTAYKEALKGVPAEPRNIFCVRLVDKVLPVAVGRLYIDTIFDSSSLTKATRLMNGIIQAFKDNLPDVSWMDRTTKKEAMDKANAVLVQVGYSLKYKNETDIDSDHLSLNVSTGSFFLDILSSMRFRNQQTAKIHVLGGVAPRTDWDMRPTEVNAFYSPLANAIGLPGGILQRPFFDKDAPAAMNFGAVGSVMGHELSHGFDDQGRHYDKHGNLRQWWSSESSKEYSRRLDCVINQYDGYTIEGQHLNGRLTLGENVADVGGIKFAFKAYKEYEQQYGKDLLPSGLEHLTSDQLYFIARGQYKCSKATPEELLRRLRTDVHSPLKWRVVGPSRDFPEYAKAFNCPEGSAMNPKNRCSVW